MIQNIQRWTRKRQTGNPVFLLGVLLIFYSYMTCAIKFPIVSAARFCCCRVA